MSNLTSGDLLGIPIHQEWSSAVEQVFRRNSALKDLTNNITATLFSLRNTSANWLVIEPLALNEQGNIVIGTTAGSFEISAPWDYNTYFFNIYWNDPHTSNSLSMGTNMAMHILDEYWGSFRPTFVTWFDRPVIPEWIGEFFALPGKIFFGALYKSSVKAEIEPFLNKCIRTSSANLNSPNLG